MARLSTRSPREWSPLWLWLQSAWGWQRPYCLTAVAASCRVHKISDGPPESTPRWHRHSHLFQAYTACKRNHLRVEMWCELICSEIKLFGSNYCLICISHYFSQCRCTSVFAVCLPDNCCRTTSFPSCNRCTIINPVCGMFCHIPTWGVPCAIWITLEYKNKFFNSH